MNKLFASLALAALVGCSADASEKTQPTSEQDPTVGDPAKSAKHEEAAFKDVLVLSPTDEATTALSRDHSKLTEIPNVQNAQDEAILQPEPVEKN